LARTGSIFLDAVLVYTSADITSSIERNECENFLHLSFLHDFAFIDV
jgi:hypothetical protein